MWVKNVSKKGFFFFKIPNFEKFQFFVVINNIFETKDDKT